MNPPYSGSLHLKFLEKTIDIADNVVSVQPATFLINTRNFGKAVSEYIPFKNKIEGHVKSCEIDNMNNEFKIGNKMPITIIHIDNKHNYDKIDYTCCKENKEVNSIYDCNLVGDINLIKSILKKISESKYNMFIDNFIGYGNKKINLPENTAYVGVANRFLTTIGSGHNMLNDNEWFKDSKHKTEYLSSFLYSFGGNKHITNTRTTGKKGTWLDCIYYNKFDSYEKNKEYLYNYIETVKTSNFFHFIACINIIDDQGADKVLKYSPMLNYNKILSDEELYNIFNITEEEQQFIEDTCKKFERHSKFIKNYWKL